MSVQLLDKTRKINKLLHNNNSSKVLFNDICEVMVETLDSNTLVISRKGKVLGVGTCPGVEEITELIDSEVGGYIDKLLNERLLGVLSTKENVNLQTLGFEGENISKYMAIISPIDIAGERLGTLFMYRDQKGYDIEDIIVNALRKFESAGVIESRSSGMKGTYIKVLNEVIFDELEEIKKRKLVKKQ